ncbi:MAG: sigma-70 family RNA polymerase sigma factor [Planctomycetota bacterium]|nr:sigma-70 family RNA polymerase sigma factor [Planctomycetota bacterium]
MSDQELLQEYIARDSQPAFTELVNRYVHLVYSAALRQVGNTAAAEDITQAVFLALSQRASRLCSRTALAGWLLTATRYAANNVLRAEARHKRREREAADMAALRSTNQTVQRDGVWNDMTPILDEAMLSLSEANRDAVLLRYFVGMSDHEVAGALGISEESARQRVSRGLARLRGFFHRRGMATTSGMDLGVLLTANALQQAPAHVVSGAVGIAAGASHTAAACTIAKGLLDTMAWINAKVLAAWVAGILLAGAGTAIVGQAMVQRQHVVAIRPAPATTATGKLTGIVKTVDGTPLAGAEVLLSGPRMFVDVHNRTRAGAPSMRTGRDGRFSLSPGNESVEAVVVRCATGFAQVSAAEFSNGGAIFLQPWGRAEGVLRSGTMPLSGELVELYRVNQRDWEAGIRHVSRAQTDDSGHFVFTRLAPGEYLLSHRVEQTIGTPETESRRTEVYSQHAVSVRVDPGKLVRADIGGNGRRLVGRLAIEGEDETVEFVGAVWNGTGKRFPARVATDGSFRVDNVSAGDYVLVLDARRHNRTGDFLPVVATLTRSFTLSPASGVGSDDAFDLGILTLKARRCLKAGQTAPPFEARGVNGQTIMLSDYLGKYTLLHLWSAGDGMWPRQQQNLKSIVDRFGDSRLVVLSLNYHNAPAEWQSPIHVAPPALSRVEIPPLMRILPTTSNAIATTRATGAVPLAGVSWPQGFLEDHSRVSDEYFNSGGVVCLIGPDGRVLSVCQESLRPIYTVLDGLQTPECRGTAGVEVLTERAASDPASVSMRFTSSPALAKDDAGASAVFTIVDGQRDARGGWVQVLNDGLGARGEDVPADAFFFRDYTVEGRLRADMSRAVTISAINTYSWHKGERGPQVYRVYGSDGAGNTFDPSPKIGIDPANCGWKLIAAVDTRSKEASSDPTGVTAGGQYAVSIQRKDGGVLGQYRYLLFVEFVTESRTPWGSGHTFYNEIDIFERQ